MVPRSRFTDLFRTDPLFLSDKIASATPTLTPKWKASVAAAFDVRGCRRCKGELQKSPFRVLPVPTRLQLLLSMALRRETHNT